MKTQDRSNPPVTAKILHEITKRWGVAKTQWVVELCFEDLFTWNTWMYAERTNSVAQARPHALASTANKQMYADTSMQAQVQTNSTSPLPPRMLAWGSSPYTYAPDGHAAPYSLSPPSTYGGAATGGGGGAAGLESGLDNGPTNGVPFDSERHVQDQYDAGYTGMYLMDCLAQIELAKIVGRNDAAAVLQARFDSVNTAMLSTLWNETAGWFQNKETVENKRPLTKMAPTNFYPLLVGPALGPSEEQAATTVVKHLTNASRFSVWPTGKVPTDPRHAPPPGEARPLVQWYTAKDGRAFPLPNSPHHLCVNVTCSQDQWMPGSYIQRLHAQIRIEGYGLATLPPSYNLDEVVGDKKKKKKGALATLVPLYDYSCSNASVNDSWVDYALGPAGWKPGLCTLSSSTPCLYVYAAQNNEAHSNLVRPGNCFLYWRVCLLLSLSLSLFYLTFLVFFP